MAIHFGKFIVCGVGRLTLRSLHGAAIVILTTSLFLLSSVGNAENFLPPKWKVVESIFGLRFNFGSCFEAGMYAYTKLQEYWAPEELTMPDTTCPTGSNSANQTIWSYRLVSDSPTTPNKDIFINTYCDDTNFFNPAGWDDTLGLFCNPNVGATTRNVGFCRDCAARVGNPIVATIGNKLQHEVDYVGSGVFPLRWERVYNSKYLDPRTTARMGANWTHFYYRSLTLSGPNPSTITIVAALRPDGRVDAYNPSGSAYIANPDMADRLQKLSPGWKLTNKDDEVELYDDSGKLTSITNRQGLTHTLAYFASGPSAGRLQSVTDHFGRTLTFEYDSQQRISAVVDPAGGRYTYTYTSDGFENLATVTFPDTKIRTYLYENTQLRYVLTGITDENGQRFATFGYESSGRAILTEHAGSAGKVTVSYPNDTSAIVTTHISSTQAAARTYSFSRLLGLLLTTDIVGPVCPSCGPATQTYDANGNVTTANNWNNFRTAYNSYDLTRNLNLVRTEGLAGDGSGISGVTQTFTTQWHPNYRLPTGLAEPFRITTMVYGAPNDSNPGNRGSLLSKTIQATTNGPGDLGFSATPTGNPRTWTYTYNDTGSVLTVNGPRTDVSDITTYTYYANNATCPGANAIGCRGQVETITNAVGHVTQITEYNVHGQPLSITDPNGLNTTLGYDTRQRLTTRNVGGESTTYAYDNAGQLTRVTLPDSSYLDYTYDNAHRLTQIMDNLGNKIVYTLDLAGNRTAEEVRDPANQLAQTRSRVYNNLNRLTQEIGAAGQTTAYDYDNQGNVTSIDGPLAG